MLASRPSMRASVHDRKCSNRKRYSDPELLQARVSQLTMHVNFGKLGFERTGPGKRARMERQGDVVDSCPEQPDSQEDHPAAAPNDSEEAERGTANSAEHEFRANDRSPPHRSFAAPHVERSQAPHVQHGDGRY